MTDKYIDVLKNIISILQKVAREKKSFDLMSLVSELSDVYASFAHSNNVNEEKVYPILDKIIELDPKLEETVRPLYPLLEIEVKGGVPPIILETGLKIGKAAQKIGRDVAKTIVRAVDRKLDGKDIISTKIPLVDVMIDAPTSLVKPLTIGMDELEIEFDDPDPSPSDDEDVGPIEMVDLDVPEYNDEDIDWAYELGNIEGGDPDSICEDSLRPAMKSLAEFLPDVIMYIKNQSDSYASGLNVALRLSTIEQSKNIYFNLSSVPVYTCTCDETSLPQLLDLMLVLHFSINEVDERIILKNMVSTSGIDNILYDNTKARIGLKTEVYGVLVELYNSIVDDKGDHYESKESTRSHMTTCDKQAKLIEKYIERMKYFIDPKQNITCIKNLIRLSRALHANNRGAIDHVGGDLSDSKATMNKYITNFIIHPCE